MPAVMKRYSAAIAPACAALLISGCATVSTAVVTLAPDLKLAPSQTVEILL
jgi:hypothetical protein